jgi:hypothetical protein
VIFQKIYEVASLEKWGDQIISTVSISLSKNFHFFLLRTSMTSSILKYCFSDFQLNFMWSLGYYTSPLIVTILYKRGFFVAESIPSLAKFSTGIGIIVVISLFMRGIGRFQNTTYVKFAKCLDLRL